MGRRGAEAAGERNETAELFNDVWRRGTYAGFSQTTRAKRSTPFLESFVRAVKGLGLPRPTVVELGAGSCDHAMRCALEGFETTAVEYSRVAVASARERFGRRRDVDFDIVQADLFAFTKRMAAKSVVGLYANSVFHFLSPDARRSQYRSIRDALVESGVLAISFKAHGDALEERGPVVGRTPAGPVVRGDDGIRRLFVKNVDVVAQEMRDEGYSVDEIVRWSVLDYNLARRSGEFIGLLARRR